MVVTAAWIIGLLFVSPPYRLNFWIVPVDDSYATRLKESKAIESLPQGYVLDHTNEWTKQHNAEVDALAKKYGGTVTPPGRDWFKENAPQATAASGSTSSLAKQHKIPAALPSDFFSRKDDYISLGKKIKAKYPGAYDDVDDADIGVRAAAKYPDALKPGPWQDYITPPSTKPRDDWQTVSPTDSFVPDEPPGFAESRTGKSLWLSGVLFGPPIVGYLVLFGLVPWIFRGFKPIG
jgi:hypothetical protein